MNNVIVAGSLLRGSFDVASTPSKSVLHRDIICEMLAGGKMPCGSFSDDVQRTLDIAKCVREGIRQGSAGESATTLRLLIPVMLVLGGFDFYVENSLASRPNIYGELLRDARIISNNNRICVSGAILPGKYVIDGRISSQFVSGMLLALPLLCGDSEIIINGVLESAGYCDMTAHIQKQHGVTVEKTKHGYAIKGNQTYSQCNSCGVEGDVSYAANFIAANKLGGQIAIHNFPKSGLQPDSVIYELLEKREVDVSQAPDLFPILAVIACAREGTTRLFNAKRLRFKECDRLGAMATELARLGASVDEGDDYLTVRGTKLCGATVSSHGDHRLVFALTIAASFLCSESVTITDCHVVRKSAPNFFEDFRRLGGVYEYMDR